MYPKFPIFCFFPKYYTSYSQYTTPSPVLELVIFEVHINEVTVYEKKPCGRETQCLPPYRAHFPHFSKYLRSTSLACQGHSRQELSGGSINTTSVSYSIPPSQKFKVAEAKTDAVAQQINNRHGTMEDSLLILKQQDGVVTAFNEKLWCGLLDYATAYADSRLTFTFKNVSTFEG